MAKKCDNEKNSCKVGKIIARILLIYAACVAIAVTVLKIIEKLRTKKAEAENPGRDCKVFYNYLGAKAIKLDDVSIDGVISKNIFGATTLDLSGVNFNEDSFISISSKFSALSIIVPSDVNVKVDGLIKSSVVNNASENDEELPTLYVASDISFSAVKITKAE